MYFCAIYVPNQEGLDARSNAIYLINFSVLWNDFGRTIRERVIASVQATPHAHLGTVHIDPNEKGYGCWAAPYTAKAGRNVLEYIFKISSTSLRGISNIII